jgi:hypothetical protein
MRMTIRILLLPTSPRGWGRRKGRGKEEEA